MIVVTQWHNWRGKNPSSFAQNSEKSEGLLCRLFSALHQFLKTFRIRSDRLKLAFLFIGGSEISLFFLFSFPLITRRMMSGGGRAP